MTNFNRKSIRLPFYDYSDVGYYFITICTHDKLCLFGKIFDNKMIKNHAGKIVEEEWLKTEIIRKNITLGSFIVMPNHFHGIVIIDSKLESRGVLQKSTKQSSLREFTSTSNSLGAIIRGFKSAVTKKLIDLNKDHELKVWQRNYYERVIRNNSEYIKIDEYVRRNHELWNQDKFYI